MVGTALPRRWPLSWCLNEWQKVSLLQTWTEEQPIPRCEGGISYGIEFNSVWNRSLVYGMVLFCSISCAIPRSHHPLLEELCEAGWLARGCVVSVDAKSEKTKKTPAPLLTLEGLASEEKLFLCRCTLERVGLGQRWKHPSKDKTGIHCEIPKVNVGC